MAWKRKIILINLAFVWSCNIGAYHNHCNFVLYMYMRNYAYTNHMSVNLTYSVHTAHFIYIYIYIYIYVSQVCSMLRATGSWDDGQLQLRGWMLRFCEPWVEIGTWMILSYSDLDALGRLYSFESGVTFVIEGWKGGKSETNSAGRSRDTVR